MRTRASCSQQKRSHVHRLYKVGSWTRISLCNDRRRGPGGAQPIDEVSQIPVSTQRQTPVDSSAFRNTGLSTQTPQAHLTDKLVDVTVIVQTSSSCSSPTEKHPHVSFRSRFGQNMQSCEHSSCAADSVDRFSVDRDRCRTFRTLSRYRRRSPCRRDARQPAVQRQCQPSRKT